MRQRVRDHGRMDQTPNESEASRRFFAALPRYHQLLAQALGAIGQAQKLDELARTAREDVVAAEQALATYRNSPAARKPGGDFRPKRHIAFRSGISVITRLQVLRRLMQ